MTRTPIAARRIVATLATAATAALPALAATTAHAADVHAVFVQTNDPHGNAVQVLLQHDDGTLTPAATYATGGNGGQEDMAVIDPLASQGSLTYDAEHHLLFAVNAGSDSFTVFSVRGSTLHREAIVASHGHLPTSIAVSRDLVYVLNAGGAGGIAGFAIGEHNRLRFIDRSTRSLGLGNPATPNFLASPSQVLLSPDASSVVVATKTHNTLVVFPLDSRGVPAKDGVVNTSAGAVPFALLFDDLGRLLSTEASGGESSYRIRHNGELVPLSTSVSNNGQKGACWSVLAKGYVYTANSGSDTITGYSEDWHGHLKLLDATGVTATTSAGPVDLVASEDGRFLYQQATHAGVIDEFLVNDDGSLTHIGSLGGFAPTMGSGIEGIAMS